MSIPTPLMVDVDDLDKVRGDITIGEFRTDVASAQSGRSTVALGLLGLTAVAGFVVWRVVSHPSEAARPAVSVSSASSTPLQVASAAPPAASSSPQTMPSRTPSSTMTASASAVAATARVAVTLLGDPGTRVAIDGASRGPCPLRVMLPEGPHEVRFTFDPTGESRGERFIVKSGDRVTVRADFTGATPTVKILR